MGITAGSSYEGGYGHEDPKEVEFVGYSEDGEPEPDRTGFTGTVDTSGVGPGRYEDLRHVTATFDRSDERIARVLDDSDKDDVNDEEGVLVEGADPDTSPAEVAERLREQGQQEANSPANPVLGDPDEVAKKAEKEREQAREEVGANGDGGAPADADDEVVETVEEGSVGDLKEAVGDDPELAALALAEERDKPEGEQRKTAIEYLEGVIAKGKEDAVEADFDPADHDVKEVVAYLERVPQAEVERVQALEADRKPAPRKTIINFGS